MWVVLVHCCQKESNLKQPYPCPRSVQDLRAPKINPLFFCELTDWDKKHTWRTIVDCDKTTTGFLQTATPHCCLLSLNILLVNLKASSPDMKYFTFVSYLKSWSSIPPSVSMQVFSVMCFLISGYCSRHSPPLWRKQTFFCAQMFSCPPLFLSPHSSFSYLGLKEMWTSDRLLVLIIFCLHFIHTDCACVHSCMYISINSSHWSHIYFF